MIRFSCSSLSLVNCLSTRNLFVRSSFVPSRSYCPPQLYSSVEEHPQPVEGKIHGEVPRWLSGRLIRNGPGLFEIGDTKYNHLFDGLALLHSFTINEGKVWYRSRFLRSDTYKKNMAANRIVVSEFGTAAHPDPCKTWFQRVSTLYQQLRDPAGTMTDNCLVNVFPVGSELVVATEGNFVHQIDSETLDSVERHQLSNYVAINGATAHSHWDTDGTAYNLGNSFVDGAMYNVIKTPPPLQQGEKLLSRTTVLSSIPARDKYSPGYYHSFGMTENYIVFVEQPFKLELKKYPKLLLLGKPFSEMFSWNSEENIRFYVVEKDAGKVVDGHFVAPSCCILHHINAYEEDGHIVVDVCAHQSGALYATASLDHLGKAVVNSKARRYVLPLNSDGDKDSNFVTLKDTKASAMLQDDGSILCNHQELSSLPFEFPQVNYEHYNGRKYQFMYGLGITTALDPEDILKVDVMNGATKCWSETDCSPSEPVFVPRPDAQTEDDGLLLSVVLNIERKRSPFLLLVDAKTMEETGRVEFEGVQMHKDLHGIFQKF